MNQRRFQEEAMGREGRAGAGVGAAQRECWLCFVFPSGFGTFFPLAKYFLSMVSLPSGASCTFPLFVFLLRCIPLPEMTVLPISHPPSKDKLLQEGFSRYLEFLPWAPIMLWEVIHSALWLSPCIEPFCLLVPPPWLRISGKIFSWKESKRILGSKDKWCPLKRASGSGRRLLFYLPCRRWDSLLCVIWKMMSSEFWER